MDKKILYIDMDKVLVNFKSGIARLPGPLQAEYDGHLDDVPGIFALMQPMPGALDAFVALAEKYDTYILSTAPWNNPSAWHDKPCWVKRYLGAVAYKRLILTHHKNLNQGDYIIDDRTKNGVDGFAGEHIHFRLEQSPDWQSPKTR